MANYVPILFKLIYGEYKDFCSRVLEKPEDNTLFKLILDNHNQIKSDQTDEYSDEEDMKDEKEGKEGKEGKEDSEIPIKQEVVDKDKDKDKNGESLDTKDVKDEKSTNANIPVTTENKAPLPKRKSCDENFFNYLQICQTKTNRNYFGYIFKLIALFREALNKYKPGDDKSTFPKNVEYSQVRNAELCPDLCNDFITDFMESANYFGMTDEIERVEVVDFVQHLCQWLFENGQTTSRLSLLG